MTSDDIKGALLLAAAGAGAYFAWTMYRNAGRAVENFTGAASNVLESVSDAAATAGAWVNPTADTNLAYRGVNAAGSWLTGRPDYSLGGNIYDAVQEIKTWSLNPASPDNPYYRTVSAAGARITGNQHWSLGTAIYDFVHPSTAIHAAEQADARRVEQVANQSYFEQFGVMP